MSNFCNALQICLLIVQTFCKFNKYNIKLFIHNKLKLIETKTDTTEQYCSDFTLCSIFIITTMTHILHF